MANTIRASKNTFNGGLVMDLSPDNTPNEVLTSALNATLVTFNGNELQLQNDMGNGRVETARLPEGYIPVGTCEFGDIIYIVSYNPLTNKSQIGCFPSPERNVSSEEIGGTGQTLSSSDFQEGGNSPTGELKASSVKKILYNNKLNPGDKFIIYDINNVISNSAQTITDYGNTSHVYGSFPKLLRIHVVAIEDSGKINYLDSTLKWYNDVNYFIQQMGSGIGGEKIDIDQYRNTLSSGYSVFQSKVSGKLALLIELEKISGFSCSYNVYGGPGEYKISENDDVIYKKYKVFWNVSWETEDPEINPSYVVLTKSQWTGKQKGQEGKYYKYKHNNDKNRYELDTNFVQLGDLDTAYPTDNYKFWSIDSITLSRDYGDFMNSIDIYCRSYKLTLENFLESQTKGQNAIYKGISLTKVNVYRSTRENYISCPSPYNVSSWSSSTSTHDYYINATRLDNYNNGIIQTLEGKEKPVTPVNIDDRIINNYFHSVIYFEGQEFQIPIKQTLSSQQSEQQNEQQSDSQNSQQKSQDVKLDISNLIYNYELTPAMPYGLLREYSIEGYIDFSKLGSGEINITAWRYFVGENSVTLTFGLDAYTEENMGISEVVMEFYDNQGMAAAYYVSNKESYSGQFTEVIPLNGYTTSYKLKNINSDGEVQYHCGEVATLQYDNVVKFDGNHNPVKTTWEEGKVTYLDDCGTLYNNMLYLVKIVVKYCPVNALGEYDANDKSSYKYFYRWMWTAPVYNDEYYHVQDFQNLDLNLNLDVNPIYETTENYYFKNIKYISPNTSVLTKFEDIYKYLSANVQVLTTSLDVTSEADEDPEGPTSYPPEETLTNVPIAVGIQRGKITEVTVYTNRTLRSVNEGLLKFYVNGSVYSRSNYSVTYDIGGTVIIFIPNTTLEYDTPISIEGQAGAFKYGNNQKSPYFNTSGDNVTSGN